MNQKRRGRLLAAAVLPSVWLGPCRCCGEEPAKPPAGAWAGETRDIVASHRGRVLLLLLGREDCPGTVRATKLLDGYAPQAPAGAAIVRVDVPLPGETLQAPVTWRHPFPYALDKDRLLARQLEFFFYPTLYVFDRDGELRFAGGCDASRLPEMVSEIAGEKPGAAKKRHSLQLPALGTVAPAFSGRGLDGQTVTLEAVRGKRATLLFFAATSCPFTVKEFPQLKALAADFQKHSVAVVIINRGEEREKIAPVYNGAVPGLPVVWDQSGEICKAYGVDAAPFFFLLDAGGQIVKRRSFTAGAAAGALNAHLGLAAETSRYKSSEAG